MSEAPAWRIVLADDHTMVRTGLRALLEADPRCHVVGECGNLDKVAGTVVGASPDLVVLDIALGRENGLDAVPTLLGLPSAPRILVLTMHDDPGFAREALGRGAHGYLLKDAAAAELIRAIEVVMAGDTYLQPQLGAQLLRAEPVAGGLSERERDVLRLLARGHTNAEIAHELFISLRTVEAHRAGLRARLGAHHRSELVDAARRLGLLT
ncbi:response regulator transcription factor [Kineosporia sp. J2-2]|uniref:Response regulator transcription factor n=1 Tax=Kineosporia corallincola TaxID=2835133 RepID=A0ABS5TB58_9ACTN|nr:response regulator transcription factor [Kineosporia corallincola]MBT0768302.1 response regulator transcription factor [Kineosporia corallincola]